MSVNYVRDEATRVATIAHWGFDVPPQPGSDAVPSADWFEDQMLNAKVHHDCPVKRVKGRCGCAVND